MPPAQARSGLFGATDDSPAAAAAHTPAPRSSAAHKKNNKVVVQAEQAGGAFNIFTAERVEKYQCLEDVAYRPGTNDSAMRQVLDERYQMVLRHFAGEAAGIPLNMMHPMFGALKASLDAAIERGEDTDTVIKIHHVKLKQLYKPNTDETNNILRQVHPDILMSSSSEFVSQDDVMLKQRNTHNERDEEARTVVRVPRPMCHTSSPEFYIGQTTGMMERSFEMVLTINLDEDSGYTHMIGDREYTDRNRPLQYACRIYKATRGAQCVYDSNTQSSRNISMNLQMGALIDGEFMASPQLDSKMVANPAASIDNFFCNMTKLVKDVKLAAAGIGVDSRVAAMAAAGMAPRYDLRDTEEGIALHTPGDA